MAAMVAFGVRRRPGCVPEAANRAAAMCLFPLAGSVRGLVQLPANWTAVPAASCARSCPRPLQPACCFCAARRGGRFNPALTRTGDPISAAGVLHMLTSSARLLWCPSVYHTRVFGQFLSPNHSDGFVELLIPILLARGCAWLLAVATVAVSRTRAVLALLESTLLRVTAGACNSDDLVFRRAADEMLPSQIDEERLFGGPDRLPSRQAAGQVSHFTAPNSTRGNCYRLAGAASVLSVSVARVEHRCRVKVLASGVSNATQTADKRRE